MNWRNIYSVQRHWSFLTCCFLLWQMQLLFHIYPTHVLICSSSNWRILVEGLDGFSPKSFIFVIDCSLCYRLIESHIFTQPFLNIEALTFWSQRSNLTPFVGGERLNEIILQNYKLQERNVTHYKLKICIESLQFQGQTREWNKQV